MRLLLCLLLFAVASVPAVEVAQPDNPGGGTGQTYYVDANSGSDSNDGLTEGNAWASLQHAFSTSDVQAGDTVLVKNGDYYQVGNNWSYNWNLSKSGAPGEYITYRAFPGHRPTLTTDTLNGLQIYNASYIEIDGFEIIGLPDPDSIVGTPAGSAERLAIADDRRYVGNAMNVIQGCHHIRVRNMLIHDVGGNGIAGGANLLLIENNTIYRTAHRSQVGNSGISAGGDLNGNTPGGEPVNYGVVIRNNTIYDVKNMLGFIYYADGKYITDGNGIIIDLANNTGYTERILIANNLIFNCGGRGVHAYGSSYIDFINNTCYHNLTSADVPGDLGAVMLNEGELSNVNQVGGNIDNVFVNNIAIARPGLKAYNIHNDPQFENNLVVSDRGDQAAIDGSNVVNEDPLFVQASSDADIADFTLQAGSPAVDAGQAWAAAAYDLAGDARPSGSAFDMGVFEYRAVALNRVVLMQVASWAPEWFVRAPSDAVVAEPGFDTQEIQLQSTQDLVLSTSDPSAESVPESDG